MPEKFVFIDASALPPHIGNVSHDLAQLGSLVRTGHIKAFTSEVAADEWKSARASFYEKQSAKMFEVIASVLKAPFAHSLPQYPVLRELHDKSVYEVRNTLIAAEVYCDSLLESAGIKLVGKQPEDQDNVFHLYFAGLPPFAGPKSREDIPDAFIFEAGKRILRQYATLDRFVVCEDARLSSAFEEIEGVKTFKSIKEFLSASEIKDLWPVLELFQLWRMKQNIAVGFLKQNEYYLREFVDNEKEMVCGALPVKFPPAQNSGASGIVVSIHGMPHLQFRWHDLQMMHEGRVRLPFSFKTVAEIYFTVPEFVLSSLPPWVRLTSGALGKPPYEAMGERFLRVDGMLSIQFDAENLSGDEITLPTDMEIECFKGELLPGED